MLAYNNFFNYAYQIGSEDKREPDMCSSTINI